MNEQCQILINTVGLLLPDGENVNKLYNSFSTEMILDAVRELITFNTGVLNNISCNLIAYHIVSEIVTDAINSTLKRENALKREIEVVVNIVEDEINFDFNEDDLQESKENEFYDIEVIFDGESMNDDDLIHLDKYIEKEYQGLKIELSYLYDSTNDIE